MQPELDPEQVQQLLDADGIFAPSKVTITSWNRFKFAAFKKTVPVAQDPGANGSGRKTEEIVELVIIDPDTGDRHHFTFGEDARQELLRSLTGGVVLP